MAEGIADGEKELFLEEEQEKDEGYINEQKIHGVINNNE